MKKKKVAVMAAVLVSAGAATLAYAYFRTDPEVAKVKKMAEGLSGKERNPEQWKQLREAMDKLSPDQRKQVWGEMGAGFRDRARNDMRKYFALSQKERTAYLDKQIKDDEKRRRDWASKKGQRKGQGGPQVKAQGGPNGGNANGANNNNGNNNNNANNAGQGPRQPPTAEQRDQRRKQMLDNTTPEDRALRAEFRNQMNQRRQQLGMPPMSGRFGR